MPKLSNPFHKNVSDLPKPPMPPLPPSLRPNPKPKGEIADEVTVGDAAIKG